MSLAFDPFYLIHLNIGFIPRTAITTSAMKNALKNALKLEDLGVSIIMGPAYAHSYNDSSLSNESMIDLKTLGLKPGLEHDISMTRDDLWQNGDNLHFKPKLCMSFFSACFLKYAFSD